MFDAFSLLATYGWHSLSIIYQSFFKMAFLFILHNMKQPYGCKVIKSIWHETATRKFFWLNLFYSPFLTVSPRPDKPHISADATWACRCSPQTYLAVVKTVDNRERLYLYPLATQVVAAPHHGAVGSHDEQGHAEHHGPGRQMNQPPGMFCLQHCHIHKCSDSCGLFVTDGLTGMRE